MQKISKKISYESILCILLFLFPLFALGVRHWASITFSLTILLGIVYSFSRLRREPVELHKYEKLYLLFLTSYFVVFLFSLILNPFDSFGDTRFGNEIRFLLVIPLYFLLIKSKLTMRYLVYGSAGGIIIGFGFCIYELYFQGHKVFHGEYSKLFTGPVILLYLVVVLSYWIPKLSRNNQKSWLFLIVLTIIATFSIIASEVRAAYIGYAILSGLFIVFYLKGWLRIASLPLLFAFIAILSIYSNSINSRMSVAIGDFINYLSSERPEDLRVNEYDSLSTRLELWYSAKYFLKEDPLLGAGNGNFNKKIREYIQRHLVNQVALNYPHPHNVFVGATVDKGLLGLSATLLVFFFPIYVYFRTYKLSKYSALSGILYVITMFIFSMNETAPFEKSNFLATYLVFSLVIFRNHMRHVKEISS